MLEIRSNEENPRMSDGHVLVARAGCKTWKLHFKVLHVLQFDSWKMNSVFDMD